MATTFIRYRVYITPLVSTGVYGTRTEVTNNVDASGISTIKRSLDSGDFDVGIYTYSHITLKGLNRDGLFNDSSDSRSMFPAGRDLAKVEVEFIQVDPADDGSEANQVNFFGLVNEESTKSDPIKDEVRFKVLSRDSIIRNTKIPSGSVPNSTLCSAAMKTILNNPRITTVLGFDQAKINPDLDFTIDTGSVFDDANARKKLNELLLASNSVFLIDSGGDMVVQSRDESAVSTINLFGKDDIHGRENIMDIRNFNTGTHRVFSSVVVNGREKNNSDVGETFGFKQKNITFDFLTSTTTIDDIADRLALEFAVPKMELEVTIDTPLVKDSALLDRFSITYPLRVKPPAGTFLPIVGVAEIDDVLTPLPFTFGSLIIDPATAWKAIEIKEDSKKFLTTLKLREKGTTISDGVF